MEKKLQFFYRTNEKIELRSLELEDTCMNEKKGEEIMNTWIYTYSGEKLFHGYKNIPACRVTEAYQGDCILDMHDNIPVSVKDGKPDITNQDALYAWIGNIFGARLFRLSKSVKGNFKNDLVDYSLIGVICIMIIVWGIKFATG